MTLQQIRYILEISRCGSISKAAQQLLLTQPYLSSILKDLENELGITIFHRDRRGVTLTEEGREFLYYARPMLEQEQRIEALYSKRTAKPPLHVSISTQRYPFVIQAFMRFFQKWDPERYEICLRECGMYHVINHVYEKKSDLGIIFLSGSTEAFIRKYLDIRNIQFNEIVSIAPCVFFHKDHPMARHAEVDMEEMARYPYASFESDAAASLDFSEEAPEEALLANFGQIQRHFSVADRGTMINILTHTDAFSIGSGILPPGFAGPELVSRPIRGQGKDIRLGWIQAKGAPLSAVSTAFVDELRKTLHQG